MAVQAGNLPVTANPDIAEAVGAADGVGILDGDQLADKALPEVEAVRVGLQLGVLDGDAVRLVGDGEDVAAVELGVLLGRRLGGVNANNEGLERRAGGLHDDVDGEGEFGEVEVVCGRPVEAER